MNENPRRRGEGFLESRRDIFQIGHGDSKGEFLRGQLRRRINWRGGEAHFSEQFSESGRGCEVAPSLPFALTLQSNASIWLSRLTMSASGPPTSSRLATAQSSAPSSPPVGAAAVSSTPPVRWNTNPRHAEGGGA